MNKKTRSGSDRDKNKPTKKQNKWSNLFYTFANKRIIAFKEKIKKMRKTLIWKQIRKPEDNKNKEKSNDR